MEQAWRTGAAFGRLRTWVLLVAVALAVAACDSSEERAEGHYQSGLALLESGDRERARVEFLTVFKYNGQHRDARATLARLLWEDGRASQAYSQYLRLVEQYPEDAEGLRMLAQIGIQIDSWDRVATHVAALEALEPAAPETQVLRAALDYREAVIDQDDAARRDAAARAEALVEDLPDSVIARAPVADALQLDGEYARALEELDRIQELDPNDLRFYRMRLAIYAATGDEAGVATTLRRMVDQFPDDPAMARRLLGHYASRGDLESAEAFLREQVVEGEPADDARVALVRFANEVRGLDAAVAEAERFLEEGTNDQLFRSLRATLLFDSGETDTAIAELEAILDAAEPGPSTRDIKITLAQILVRTGNVVGARALVEEVVEEDPGHVSALRMKANWLIEADDTTEAIAHLRRALDQDPTNPGILKSLAQAHLRNGSRELAGEMLSLAVETSNRAMEQSLDYARFLIADERLEAAETVLVDALRVTPGNVDLLDSLGRVYMLREDFARAEQVERTLRASDTAVGQARADSLRLLLLQAQQRGTEALTFLEGLSAETDGSTSADLAIVRFHLDQNDLPAAESYLQALLEEDPENPNLRFLAAGLNVVKGAPEAAEAGYRALIDDGFDREQVWIELVKVLIQTDRTEAAEAALDMGLESNPNAAGLMWMRATLLERRGDSEGALQVYEDLYALNSNSVVIANNLASMLSTLRDDEESLQRAWRIARRLRDSEFAPFQDTYGWIAFLRGDHEDALRHLEPAAQALTDEPRVQVHYGLALAANGRVEEAAAQLDRALALAGDDPDPVFERARVSRDELRQGDNRPTSVGD